LPTWTGSDLGAAVLMQIRRRHGRNYSAKKEKKRERFLPQ
jgi:hypothetical protein